MIYVCHSGGAVGADMWFETEGEKYGVRAISYSFIGHRTLSKNRKILTEEELKEGWEHVLIANRTLRRHIDNLSPYVKNLLSRDWFQVKNSDSVYAVSEIEPSFKTINGGTGWACQMSVDNEKPVFVFDQNRGMWFEYSRGRFLMKDFIFIPTLTENFSGIGTRELNENGQNAIRDLYKSNIKK